eukprot:Gb_26626 [translate_table: standard]
MERRQKRRLEEIRETQKKDKKTMDLKEQVRGQVRAELERMASNCKDMASLLRQLGIPVEGGAIPSSQQGLLCCPSIYLLWDADKEVFSTQEVKALLEDLHLMSAYRFPVSYSCGIGCVTLFSMFEPFPVSFGLGEALFNIKIAAIVLLQWGRP